MHYLYAIQNKINGKIYIGQTVDIRQRYYAHKHKSTNIKLRHSINKYGIDQFEYWVFAVTEHRDEINLLETEWIFRMRDMIGKNNVYNIDDGGNTFSHSRENIEARILKTKTTWAKRRLAFDNSNLK